MMNNATTDSTSCHHRMYAQTNAQSGVHTLDIHLRKMVSGLSVGFMSCVSQHSLYWFRQKPINIVFPFFFFLSKREHIVLFFLLICPLIEGPLCLSISCFVEKVPGVDLVFFFTPSLHQFLLTFIKRQAQISCDSAQIHNVL